MICVMIGGGGGLKREFECLRNDGVYLHKGTLGGWKILGRLGVEIE